jgi:exo-1,4-beta-D-glucosaminidase
MTKKVQAVRGAQLSCRLLWGMILLLLSPQGSFLAVGFGQTPSGPVGRITIDEHWQMKSSVLVPESGEQISQPNYPANQWHPTRLPATALSTLIRNGVYPDLRIGLNSFRIPDSSDEFNQKHDLAKYSYLPDGRNPWRDPYWFRTTFHLPDSVAGKRVWLTLKGINYRADVWLNGRRIADAQQVVGAFSRHRLDATAAARPGANALALRIHPVDHPGVPETQLELFGRDRPFRKEIMKDVTLVMSIGYDCMPTVPDRHLGLWQGVEVEWTEPVDIRHPFVRTELPLPATSPARLTVSAELTNCSDRPVEGVLTGRLEQTGGAFSAQVALQPGHTKQVVFKPEDHPALVIENPRLWWPNGYGDQPLYTLRLQFYLSKIEQSKLAQTRWAQPPVEQSTSAQTEWDQKEVEKAETPLAAALPPWMSLPRKWQSRRQPSQAPWIPASAGMTQAPLQPASPSSQPGSPAVGSGESGQTAFRVSSAKSGDANREALGELSDQEDVRFGIRQISRELYQRGDAHGLRLYINGRRIFCRGGYLQPEILFDWDARRMEAEIRYLTHARLNLVFFEDIPVPPDEFLDLCDRYGLMFGNCFYGCYWMQPGTSYPEDLELLARSTVDIIRRIRNHPSLVLYMAMNEGETRREVYTMWREAIQDHDGTRLGIPSGSFPDYRKEVPEWIRPDLPVGVNDYPPKSYGWVEPEQFFRWVREKGNWMFMLESGSPSVPPIESLRRFLPDLEQARPDSPHWPLTSAWAHHDACHYFKPYDEAMRRIFGQPKTVADYCRRSQLLTYDQHRAMFEAVQHRMWEITSGFCQWKLNACWPSVEWQIYDWYLRPMLSLYAIRKATEPLHVQLSPLDRMVTVVSSRPEPVEGLRVRARLLDLDSKLRWEHQQTVDIPADGFREIFPVPVPEDITPVYFVRLDLVDRNARQVSENFYWLPRSDLKELAHLEKLPAAEVSAQMTLHPQATETAAEVTVQNRSDRIAFLVHLSLCRPTDGEEILPVWWDDNYVCLLPGESRPVRARFPKAEAGGEKPLLKLTGWNVRQRKDALPKFCVSRGAPPTSSPRTAQTP